MLQTIEDMHYDLKQKLNKIDSNAYRNLRIPEIDWKLREAETIFIKTVAFPSFRTQLGFESNQRTIDDIRTIVREKEPLNILSFDSTSYVAELPGNYLFYISSNVKIQKDSCEDWTRVRLVQHDDTPEHSPFDSSSFEWRVVNGRFFGTSDLTPGIDYLRLFTDGTFQISEAELNYIKQPAFMHYAQGFPGGQYTLPNGSVLGLPGNLKQDCELPIHVRSEIVDIAVLIITGELMIPDYTFKQAKLQMALN